MTDDVYDLKTFKYRECRWCLWVSFVSDKSCPKCNRVFDSTITFLDFQDEDDIRFLFTSQIEWIKHNKPSYREIKESLEYATDLYRVRLL